MSTPVAMLMVSHWCWKIENENEGTRTMHYHIKSATSLNSSIYSFIIHPSILPHTAAAEGAYLSVWYFDEFKCHDLKKPPPQLHLLSTEERPATTFQTLVYSV